jgi:hypothetical protein
LELIDIRGSGTLDRERVVMRAVKSLDLRWFVVMAARRSESGGIALPPKLAYWFPDGHTVQAGEYVRLYTKAGRYEKREGTFDGVPAVFHDFHWGRSAAVWDSSGTNAAVVLRVQDWSSVPVAPKTPKSTTATP